MTALSQAMFQKKFLATLTVAFLSILFFVTGCGSNKKLGDNDEHIDNAAQIGDSLSDNDSEKLMLAVIITDTAVTISVRNGFLPSLFYRKANDDDFYVIDPDCAFRSINENADIDSCDIATAFYTKNGEMLTDDATNPIQSIKRGDTYFTLTNPRKKIVAANLDNFEKRPLLLFDELKNRLLFVKTHFGGKATDTNDIVIGAQDGVAFGIVHVVIFAARFVGSENVSIRQIENVLDDVNNRRVLSGRSRNAIQNVVSQNAARLRQEYNNRLRDKPGLHGRIDIKFAIREDGVVIFANVESSTMNDPEFEEAIISIVKSWNFGRINLLRDVTEVTYPFVFTE